MPNQVDANRIGRVGERWFSNQLPSDWIIQKPSEDIGVDGNIVICDNSNLNGLEFRVQIKSSAQFLIDNDKLVLSGIKYSAFQYWLTGMMPTLLVAYDASLDEGYFYWVNKYAAEHSNVLESTSSTLTLKIPKINRISIEGWEVIRTDLSNYVTGIENTFKRAKEMDLLIPTLRKLHECLNHLYTAHTAKPSEKERTPEQYAVMCEYELTIHLDFIKVLKGFIEKVKVQKEALDYFNRMINNYIDLVGNSGIGGFDKIVKGETQEVSIYQVPEFLKEGREKLLRTMIGVICTFTKSD